jgi:hypothetical protein
VAGLVEDWAAAPAIKRDTAMVLSMMIQNCLEMSVRRNRTRLGQHLATLDIVTLGATQQGSYIVANRTRAVALRAVGKTKNKDQGSSWQRGARATEPDAPAPVLGPVSVR